MKRRTQLPLLTPPPTFSWTGLGAALQGRSSPVGPVETDFCFSELRCFHALTLSTHPW